MEGEREVEREATKGAHSVGLEERERFCKRSTRASVCGRCGQSRSTLPTGACLREGLLLPSLEVSATWSSCLVCSRSLLPRR
jgi:hypothetical protein